jgi:hypothetical protein
MLSALRSGQGDRSAGALAGDASHTTRRLRRSRSRAPISEGRCTSSCAPWLATGSCTLSSAHLSVVVYPRWHSRWHANRARSEDEHWFAPQWVPNAYWVTLSTSRSRSGAGTRGGWLYPSHRIAGISGFPFVRSCFRLLPVSSVSSCHSGDPLDPDTKLVPVQGPGPGLDGDGGDGAGGGRTPRGQ